MAHNSFLLPGMEIPNRRQITIPTLLESAPRKTNLNVLVAATCLDDPMIITDFLPSLVKLPDVAVRTILDPSCRGADLVRASASCLTLTNTSRHAVRADTLDIEQEAAELCDWADLLLLAPIDAGRIAKMLHGDTDHLVLEVVRSWNVSKRILMVPGMSTLMWENPMTKKQLSKIRRKWNWIRVFSPILWTFTAGDERRKIASWDVLREVKHAVRNQIDLMNVGRDLDISPSLLLEFNASGDGTTNGNGRNLPPELWSIILDFTGDWELAQNLHIYTNLAPPAEWASHMSAKGPKHYMEALELTLLRGRLSDVQQFIAKEGVPRWLSKICIKLIMRFSMIPVLADFEAKHKDLFWATFGHTFLPDKASGVFGRVELLDFWHTSPSFLTKEYNVEALDGASRAGFINVLDWWRKSGLPLKYTEAAMEQASAQGHLRVLEWWRSHSLEGDSEASKLALKPGKSIVFATQNGHTDVVRWWLQSGIAFSHEDTVAKLASTHGHVDILRLWHDFKGKKMIFDNQVLVGATKMANVAVLEWWKHSALKVEYKTCDIEEALEDGLEGRRGDEVKRWWARNGLNLGIGTSEWMKTKYL